MGTNHLILAAFIIILLLALPAWALTNINDPTGKTVLTIDGDNIKNPAGTTVLTVDGDNIKDPSGKQVLYINGDNIRDKPEGKILLIIDGRHINREVGGTKILYVDGKDLMRGDRTGNPLYVFKGDDTDSQHRMAVLFALMPEIFGASKEADAALVAAQSSAGAAEASDAIKNFPPGTYKIAIFQSNDPTTHSGTVTVAQAGALLTLDFQFTNGGAPLQGVAVQRGDEVWVAAGPAGTIGLALYQVDAGNLKGTWYNVTGKPESFGTENATGPDPLGGDYKITDAKAPFTAAPYTGTLSLQSLDKKIDQTSPLFLTHWDLAGYQAKGVGFLTGKTLAVASSTTGDAQIIKFKIDLSQKILFGQFYSTGKIGGIWSLQKK